MIIQENTKFLVRQRFATEAGEAAPKKKPRIFRRILWTTATAAGTFYVGSTFVAFNNQTYYNLFSDHVPLGQSMLEYAEFHNWDTMTVESAIESVKEFVVSTQTFITDKINGTPAAVDSVKQSTSQKAHDVQSAASKAYTSTKERAKSVASQIKTDVQKVEDKVADKAGVITKHQEQQLAEELTALVREAESALAGKLPPNVTPSESTPAPTASQPPPPTAAETGKHVYTSPLPVGFEPPPGYDRPAPPPRKDVPKPPTPALPLLASSVADVSDPIIKHLAGTIDNLASYLKSNPNAAAQITPVLEAAKGDLSSLVNRIETVKEEERKGLEAKMDEQTREYTLKMIELEMEAQDKLDLKEEQFRKIFDESQVALTRAYREKLDNELRTHLEIINERCVYCSS